MREIRAVFWDVDGTMVMSEPVHDAKMVHIANTHGVTLTPETVALFHGSGDRRAYEIMQGAGMPGTLEQFLDACHVYYSDNLHTIAVREGFAEAFAYFDARGFPQAAVSNGVAPLVDMNIGLTGVREKFKAILDLDYMHENGLNPKPAADPYLDALRQINKGQAEPIRPDQCLVVEDSPTGIAAGNAAGMTTIFWRLSPEKTMEMADYTAFTGAELMDIVRDLVPTRAAA